MQDNSIQNVIEQDLTPSPLIKSASSRFRSNCEIMRATCPIFSTSLPLSIPVRNMYGIKIIEIVHRKDKRPMTIRISSPKIWLGRNGIKKTESKRKIAAARNGVAIIRDVNPTIKAFFETELVIYCTCPSSQEGSFLVKYPVTYSLYLLFPLNFKPNVLRDKL